MFVNLPTKMEMDSILEIRAGLLPKEALLFRTAKDCQVEYKTSKEQLDYFQVVASAVYGVSKLSSMTYFVHTTLKIKNDMGEWKKNFIQLLASYLISHYYIRSQADVNLGISMKDKFENVDEAIRWVMAYRISRAMILSKVKVTNEQRKEIVESIQVSPS